MANRLVEIQDGVARVISNKPPLDMISTRSSSFSVFSVSPCWIKIANEGHLQKRPDDIILRRGK